MPAPLHAQVFYNTMMQPLQGAIIVLSTLQCRVGLNFRNIIHQTYVPPASDDAEALRHNGDLADSVAAMTPSLSLQASLCLVRFPPTVDMLSPMVTGARSNFTFSIYDFQGCFSGGQP